MKFKVEQLGVLDVRAFTSVNLLRYKPSTFGSQKPRIEVTEIKPWGLSENNQCTRNPSLVHWSQFTKEVKMPQTPFYTFAVLICVCFAVAHPLIMLPSTHSCQAKPTVHKSMEDYTTKQATCDTFLQAELQERCISWSDHQGYLLRGCYQHLPYVKRCVIFQKGEILPYYAGPDGRYGRERAEISKVCTKTARSSIVRCPSCAQCSE